MEKIYFIVNPASGKGRGNKIIPRLKSILNRNPVKHEIIITEGPNHATDICKDISDNSSGVIVSVGGDGTLNEVINGLNLEKENTIGVLPIGSGNDFIKNIGLKKIFDHDIDLILNNKNRKYITVDIGIVEYFRKNSASRETKIFSNAVGIGFDAQVAHLNQNNKKLSGIISYIHAVFRSLKSLKYLDLSLKFNDLEINGHKLLVTVGNGISSGGGFYLNPYAIVDDGLLDITIVDKISKPRLVQALPKALFNKLETVAEAKMYKSKAAMLKLNFPAYVHTDGESLGNDIVELNIQIIEKKVKFISG